MNLLLSVPYCLLHFKSFVGFSPKAPHEVVDTFKARIPDENRRKFAGMLSKLDESVGRVTEALAEAGMLRDSIIVFTTDNGGPAEGFDQNYASNWPLRGVSFFQ